MHTGEFKSIVIERLDKIERLLVKDPFDPESKPGILDRMNQQDSRIKNLEGTHKTIRKWAGVAASGGVIAAGASVWEWFKSHAGH
jgi:hypothetical protein